MSCLRPIYLQTGTVPCGACWQCRQQRAAQWSFRLNVEARHYVGRSAFVTLTYSDLPYGGSLVKSDLQKYFKILRKDVFGSQKSDLKYYACGEYGSETHRPHYHCLVFGVNGTALQASWRDSDSKARGLVHVGNVSSSSIGYCTQYLCKAPLTKRQLGDRTKEFAVMSKGLGLSYLSPAVVRYFSEDPSRTYLTERGGVKVPMPRYYADRLFSVGDKEYQKSLREDRLLDVILDAESDYLSKVDTREPFAYYRKLRELKMLRAENPPKSIGFNRKKL